MSSDLFKYPRTRHLQGSRLGPGDEDLTQVSVRSLRGHYLVIEEKVDGANAGVSFDSDANLQLQCRGHYLVGGPSPTEQQFNQFRRWGRTHQDALFDVLGDQYLLFGEWLYAKHTLYYDRLPALFVAHSVYDPADQSFVPQERAREALAAAGFSVPRLIATRVPSIEALYGWMDMDSEFGDCKVEGVYVKVTDITRPGTIHRFKMVRPDFRSDPDWVHRSLVRNKVK